MRNKNAIESLLTQRSSQEESAFCRRAFPREGRIRRYPAGGEGNDASLFSHLWDRERVRGSFP